MPSIAPRNLQGAFVCTKKEAIGLSDQSVFLCQLLKTLQTLVDDFRLHTIGQPHITGTSEGAPRDENHVVRFRAFDKILLVGNRAFQQQIKGTRRHTENSGGDPS